MRSQLSCRLLLGLAAWTALVLVLGAVVSDRTSSEFDQTRFATSLADALVSTGGAPVGSGSAIPRGGSEPPVRNLTSGDGYDISWPQCGGSYPSQPYGYGIVGITGGRAFTENRCLADQWLWASGGTSGASGYINVHLPKPDQLARYGATGPYGTCGPDRPCQLGNAGYAEVVHALEVAERAGVSAPTLWLDVETLNTWSEDTGENRLLLDGAIRALRDAGIRPGVYSTIYMWETLTGGYAPEGIAAWFAIGSNGLEGVPAACGKTLAGAPVTMVQYLTGTYDQNVLCDAATDQHHLLFNLEP